MKKITFLSFAIMITAVSAFAIAAASVAKATQVPTAAPAAAKLPYPKGESFIVTQGYHSPPTHIKKDDFAMDLTQDGCDAYGKLALAALSGTILLAEDTGYDGGYGTQVLLLSEGNVLTRYAHMIPGSLLVSAGESIQQGTPLGEIGDTGLVSGNACALHPGTHIHFAMDTENPDGTFTAKNAEPISGYTGITEGHWYLSDNAIQNSANYNATENAGLTAIAAETLGGEDAATLGNSNNGGTNKTDAVASATPPSESNPITTTGTSTNPAQAKPSDATAASTIIEGQIAPSETASPATTLAQAMATAETIAQLLDANQAASWSSSLSSSSPLDLPQTVTANTNQNQTSPSQAPQGGGVSVSASVTASPQSSSANSSTTIAITPTSTTVAAPTTTSTMATTTTTESQSQAPEASSSASSTPMASSSVPVVLGTGPQTPQIPIGATSIASFDSSTLAIDLAWQPSADNGSSSSASSIAYSIFLVGNNSTGGASSSSPILLATTSATSFSYPIPDADYGNDDSFAVQATDAAGHASTVATTTFTIPAWMTAIQPVDDNDSFPSWYSDNWYDLGTGLDGTIRSLTLEGYVNSDQYGSSALTLEEFSDAGYANLDHTFPIAPTPFAQVTQKITVPNLTIPLQPEKYYRLTTDQSYQNRSVVLKGTDATGTAMWDNYVPGVGGVQYQYSFYPYLSAIIDPEELPIRPPTMQGSPAVSFDDADSEIDVSWPAAQDQDEPNVALNYEVNLSTSTALDPGQWQSVEGNLSATLDVTFPETYTIAVRALDDFNDPSQPITTSWSFPAGYAPVPSQFDHSAYLGDQGGSQEISFAATTTISQVDFWVTPEQGIYCCSQTFLSVHKDDGGKPGDEIPSGNPVVTFDKYSASSGEEGYPFSSPITFWPGIYWFTISIGPSDTTSPTKIYGSSDDAYPGGYWSGNPSVDAYFRLVK